MVGLVATVDGSGRDVSGRGPDGKVGAWDMGPLKK